MHASLNNSIYKINNAYMSRQCLNALVQHIFKDKHISISHSLTQYIKNNNIPQTNNNRNLRTQILLPVFLPSLFMILFFVT